MRKPRFLSPSSLNKFESNRDEFYLSYLAESRSPKIPQTPPMSVGSAFDAYCKSELYSRAVGDRNPAYEFDYLFTRGVEPHNRDFALGAGKYIYNCYVASGAFECLDSLIKASTQPPQFEFEIEGEIGGVPLLGKPDCRFFHKDGAHIILDWKVNGFCSKYATSPNKHYYIVRDGWTDGPPSRGAGRAHPEYKEYEHLGVKIHEGWLETSSPEWADQLATYGWMLGEPVGDEQVIMAIDQIVAKPTEGLPQLRIASFAARVSRHWQFGLLARYQSAWDAIQNEHIFTEMPKEESQGRCELLENQAGTLSDSSDFGRYINEITRGR